MQAREGSWRHLYRGCVVDKAIGNCFMYCWLVCASETLFSFIQLQKTEIQDARKKGRWSKVSFWDGCWRVCCFKFIQMQSSSDCVKDCCLYSLQNLIPSLLHTVERFFWKKSAFGLCEGLIDRIVWNQRYMQLEKFFRQEIDLWTQLEKSIILWQVSKDFRSCSWKAGDQGLSLWWEEKNSEFMELCWLF